jgi:hypothetical protein
MQPAPQAPIFGCSSRIHTWWHADSECGGNPEWEGEKI